MNQEDIERNIAFIVDQQAKFFADIEELKALGKRTDARLSRAIRLGIAEARQEREKRRAVDERMTAMEERLSVKLDILIDAQIRAEERQAKAEERQARVEEQQARTEQALERMADAITKTNQRIDVLENGKP